ncbi:hypothetical protein GCM10009765_80970 [Fodinicola feengrottensis]|uniref:Peptidase M28 domain-containing protein n=1 Tax=Fodinicola feengrottensis TaxID=435914 RepID=A0ABN2J965_9ACTN
MENILRDAGTAVSAVEFEASVRDVYATPVLEWGGQKLVHRRDFAEHLASAEAPDLRSAALATVDEPDWSGLWILAPSANPEHVRRAVAEGAAGLLVPRAVDEAGWMPKMIAGPPVVAVPVISVRTDLHAAMTKHPARLQASVPMRSSVVTGVNVFGEFRAPRAGGMSILLTAHRDGVGDDPDLRFPAAADNASGVAVVVEAVRLLVPVLPPDVGLAVALLDGEEVGTWGSAHHAPSVRPGTYVINVDGAAHLSEAAAIEAGGPAEPLLAALDQAGRHVGVPLRAGSMASDNRRYAAAGLPAVGIGMGMPGYQTPAETPDRVNDDTLLAATRLVVETVRVLVGIKESGVR